MSRISLGVLKQTTVRSCLSVTQMCGMYDGSGDFFYSIGLPAKSGVGGGVFLVVPKLMGICIFSPRLDAQGNSVRGVDMAKRLIQEYRLHLYDGVMTDSDRIDPRLPLARWRASQSSEALWAASKGDVRTLLRLHEGQFNLEAGDYDQRTPMHIAAAEGHVEVIEFLLDRGVRPMPDRWGGYPISDAMEGEHTEVVEVFRKKGMIEENPNHFVQNPNGLKDNATEYNDDLAIVELLWAAAENNIGGLRRLVAQGVPVHAQDYDQRTALHLAAAEGHPELEHLEAGTGFKELIDVALEMPGFTQDEPLREVMTGFGHNAVLNVADQVVNAVKAGQIRHFFLVGGCDGAKPGRSYYTEFVEKVPQDCVILTLACGKFRFFEQQLGDIGGIPRYLDMGQCNDAYSAIQVALALANAFDTDVNQLPLSMVISWYEQKAIAVLLTLLHLGIKNILLGPTLPTFLTPNVLSFLSQQYQLKKIGDPQEDLEACLAR